MTLFAFTPKLPSPFNRCTADESSAPDASVPKEQPVSGPPQSGVEAGADQACAATSADRGATSVADATRRLLESVSELSLAVMELPEGKRKKEITDQASVAVELVLSAHRAGQDVQRIEKAIPANPAGLPATTLTAHRKALDSSIKTISVAVDALDQLDKAVEDHCADYPSNRGVVRTAIAAVVSVLLTLGLMLVFPPAGAVAAGFVSVAGSLTVAQIISEYSDRVNRRTACWTAGQAIWKDLDTIAKKACAMADSLPSVSTSVSASTLEVDARS